MKVFVRYLGHTNPLRLKMLWLTKSVLFQKETDGFAEAEMDKADAQRLITENPKGFRIMEKPAAAEDHALYTAVELHDMIINEGTKTAVGDLAEDLYGVDINCRQSAEQVVNEFLAAQGACAGNGCDE